MSYAIICITNLFIALACWPNKPFKFDERVQVCVTYCHCSVSLRFTNICFFLCSTKTPLRSLRQPSVFIHHSFAAFDTTPSSRIFGSKKAFLATPTASNHSNKFISNDEVEPENTKSLSSNMYQALPPYGRSLYLNGNRSERKTDIKKLSFYRQVCLPSCRELCMVNRY